MEFLLELLIDLIVDGSIELSTSKKVPSFIRYFLIIFIVLLYLSVIGILFVLGIIIGKENIGAGLILIILSLVFLIFSVLEFRKKYLDKGKETNKK